MLLALFACGFCQGLQCQVWLLSLWQHPAHCRFPCTKTTLPLSCLSLLLTVIMKAARLVSISPFPLLIKTDGFSPKKHCICNLQVKYCKINRKRDESVPYMLSSCRLQCVGFIRNTESLLTSASKNMVLMYVLNHQGKVAGEWNEKEWQCCSVPTSLPQSSVQNRLSLERFVWFITYW